MKRAEQVALASRQLLEPLRRSPIAISSSGEADPERARLVPQLQAMVRGVPGLRAAARRRNYRRMYAMAAATLLFIGAGSVLHLVRQAESAEGLAPQGATVVEGSLKVGIAPPLVKGNRFVGEAAIETPKDASARFVTESGVEVALSSASKARLHPAERRQRVELMQGEVTLQVPRLSDGSTVTVVTPDATVTVHGTRFSVSYDANTTRPATCVRVMEGVVSVNRAGRVESLHADQSSRCDTITASQPEPQAAVTTQLSPGRERVTATALPERMDNPTSSLALENQLLLAGLAAERRHDDDVAKAALQKLLTRFPASPLAQEARHALSRIEKRR
jgi:hypothetical protein